MLVNSQSDIQNINHAEEKICNLVLSAFWAIAFSKVILASQTQAGGWSKIQQLTPSVFMLGGICLLIVASYRWLKISHILTEMPKWVPAFWVLLLVWGGVTIFRSFELNIFKMYYLFGKPMNSAPWLIPMFMVLGSSVLLWRKLVSLFYVHALLGIIFFVYSFFFMGRISYANLFYAVPILLILHPFFSRKKKMLHFGLIIIYIFLCLAIGSRTGMARIFYYVGVWFIMTFYAIGHGRRFVFGLSGLVVLMALFFSSFYLYKGADISFLPGSLQSNVREFQEGDFRNTRKFMYGELWNALDEDDKLLGRGALGGYYSQIYYGIHKHRGNVMNPGWRNGIECGYLHTILKGGLVMVALILILAIPAIFLGIFRSQNLFSRLCGFIVLERLITMYPYGVPDVRLQYVLFWMCVGCCLSPAMRARTNSDFDFSPTKVVPRFRLKW